MDKEEVVWYQECDADELGKPWQPLDNKTLNRLEAAVSKSSHVGAGKKLKVKNTVRVLLSRALCAGANPSQVNPDIVGGLVVEVGDRTIDLSVSAKIAKMNKLLNDTL
jgi:F-type H+-transporting ATPase subunit O